MPRPKLKTTTLTVRVEPALKKALAAAAVHERRSLANMLEVMVLAWCKDHAIEPKPTKPKKSTT